MSKTLDQLLLNPDIARVLCIAVAVEADKAGEVPDARELTNRFNSIVRALDRQAFTDECRKLKRLGTARYLTEATRALRK